jgi:hypothetical protein
MASAAGAKIPMAKTFGRTMISKGVNHVMQRIQSSFKDIEFTGDNVKFSSMGHLRIR